MDFFIHGKLSMLVTTCNFKISDIHFRRHSVVKNNFENIKKFIILWIKPTFDSLFDGVIGGWSRMDDVLYWKIIPNWLMDFDKCCNKTHATLIWAQTMLNSTPTKAASCTDFTNLSFLFCVCVLHAWKMHAFSFTQRMFVCCSIPVPFHQ